MMKHAAITVVASLAIPLATPAKSDCLSYEPSRVSIQGALNRVIFPGPPNFQDVERGDKPEPYFVLQLQQPVCVDKGKYEDEPSLSDILSIQLGLTGPQYSQFRSLLGKRVRLSGTLSAATTGHHHTPVMLGAVVLEEK
jgi:hypothetical protein